jgi:lauroyl/myristoyl acyltransferase
MSSVEPPAQPDDGVGRYLRRMQRLARIPWPCLWGVGSLFCRSHWGRRWIAWRGGIEGDVLTSARQLFDSMQLPPDRLQDEWTRVYQNALFEGILLARVPTLSPRQFARQFEAVGLERLEEERLARRPIILGGSHFGVPRLLALGCACHGVEVMSLEHDDLLAKMGAPKPATFTVVEVGTGFKAQTTFRALRHLQSGGCVHVTGDRQREHPEPRSYRRTFHGISRQYAQGMANLSLLSGATIFPSFCTLQADGRVRIEIQPAIRPPTPPAPAGSPERDAQIGEVIHRFATVHEAEIEKTPGNQCWKRNPDARLATDAGSPDTPIP